MRSELATVIVLTVACAALLGSQRLGGVDESWIEGEVAAIATEDETALFRSLESDADRATFARIFWLRRDPTPGTPENELLADFERRTEVANDTFRARVGPGSRSEMGQLFLVLGFPETVDTGRGAAIEIGGGTNPAALEGSSTELETPGDRGTLAGGSGSSRRIQTWSYPADEAAGFPDGLDVQFRAQPGYGYRLVRTDEVERALALGRRALITRPDVAYERDAEGRLVAPSVGAATDLSPAQSILDALLEGGEPSSDVSFRVEPAFFRASEGTVYMPLLFEVEPENVSWSDGAARVVFFGAVRPLGGGPANRFEHGAAIERDSPRFDIPLQLAPGDYSVHLGVLDEASGRHGSRVTNLRVPSYDDESLTMSSVLVHAGITRTEEPAGTPGHAFQFGPLEIEPKGASPFGRDESLGLFYYAYFEPGRETEITTRYAFFQGGQEIAQTQPKALVSGDGQAVATDEIPLASFPPGDYRVSIHLSDTGTGEELERAVRFRVEP